jgi:hypothetical protein
MRVLSGEPQRYVLGEGFVEDAFGGGGVAEGDDEVYRLGVVDDFVLERIVLVGG